MAVLERYSSLTGTFAEIGGNQPVEFHKRCALLITLTFKPTIFIFIYQLKGLLAADSA
jgi:hypothetical protein